MAVLSETTTMEVVFSAQVEANHTWVLQATRATRAPLAMAPTSPVAVVVAAEVAGTLAKAAAHTSTVGGAKSSVYRDFFVTLGQFLLSG
jgi:hypothetical protein